MFFQAEAISSLPQTSACVDESILNLSLPIVCCPQQRLHRLIRHIRQMRLVCVQIHEEQGVSRGGCKVNSSLTTNVLNSANSARPFITVPRPNEPRSDGTSLQYAHISAPLLPRLLPATTPPSSSAAATTHRTTQKIHQSVPPAKAKPSAQGSASPHANTTRTKSKRKRHLSDPDHSVEPAVARPKIFEHPYAPTAPRPCVTGHASSSTTTSRPRSF